MDGILLNFLTRKQPGTFEESRSYLESKINQSYLNSISKKSFVEKLKKEYKFRINQDSITTGLLIIPILLSFRD